tara:strand:- start:379 stop:1710 length:1332 start_codon:yes stop_codon:yes gene_type:complete
MTITLRQESQAGTTTKGSSLTYAELDNSFIDLLTTKILPIQIDADTGSVKVGEAQNNGVFTITGASGISTTVTEDSAGNANLVITKTGSEGISEIVAGSNIEATTPDSGGSVTLEVTNPAILNVDGAVVFTAKNTSGATIEKGQVVYITGHDGTNPTVSIADADDAAKMPAFGLTNASISNNSTGEIITYGPITSVDTSHHTAGAELFVNTTSDSADDTITSTAPTGENGLIQKIGKVIRSHASAGVIFVTGAGRTNATPNLSDGNVFIGNAQNQVSTTALATYITDRSINNVSEDSSPQLGADLDVNGRDIISASNGNIDIQPNGTGKTNIKNMTYDENIHTITYGSNITPEPTDGPIQQILLTGSVNFQGFATEIEGATITLVITQDGTGNRTFTEDLDSNGRMLFAGGTSTLSTGANAIDIMTITFIGGIYFASLSTNFS